MTDANNNNDLAGRLNDPRNDPRSQNFDRNFAVETDRQYQQASPDQLAQHSRRMLDAYAAAHSAEDPSSARANDSRPEQIEPIAFADSVPIDVAGYQLHSNKLAGHMDDLAGDDLFNSAKAFAQKAGLTDRQFNAFVGPVLELMVDTSGAVDPATELAKLVPPAAAHLPETERRQAAGERVKAAHDFVANAERQGLDRNVAEYFVAQLCDSALGIQAIEWFMGNHRAPGHGSQPQADPSSASDAALNDRLNDPRNDPRSNKFDRNFSNETDRLWRSRYGM